MSGHMVALISRRFDQWMVRLMMKLDGDDELKAYWHKWYPSESYEQAVAEAMAMQLKGEVQEVREV